MKSVASMRNSVIDAQKVESTLRQEVQKSLAMVEDMQLEKAQTKVSVNCYLNYSTARFLFMLNARWSNERFLVSWKHLKFQFCICHFSMRL